MFMKSKIYSLKNKITTLFNQGLTPKELSQSVIVSVLISIIPIIGVSTFILTAISLKRKLNLPIMISLSYLMWPIQILLIIPFIRVGEFIFCVPSNHHNLEEITSSFQHSFFKTLGHFSFELLCGFGGWFIITVPISIAIYLMILLFLKTKKKDKVYFF